MSAEAFSRAYVLLADRTSTPSGQEWEHGPLQRLVRDLLAAIADADHPSRAREEVGK